jgi:hypothetical protein
MDGWMDWIGGWVGRQVDGGREGGMQLSRLPLSRLGLSQELI